VSQQTNAGDVDLTFSLPRGPEFTVAATNVGGAGEDPAVDLVETGAGDYEFTFTLPGAKSLAIGNTTTVDPANDPSVTLVSNGDNSGYDINFSLPRAVEFTSDSFAIDPVYDPIVMVSVDPFSGDQHLGFNLP
ncbi:MAG: hypothetical protein ACK55I_46435, partial [bacterium]